MSATELIYHTERQAGEALCAFHKSSDKECEKHYKFGRTLGQGSFATVKLCQAIEDKSKWAVKIVKRNALSAGDEESLRSEIAILQKVNHERIVATKEIFDSPHFVYFIMECMSGGELFDRIVAKDHYSEMEAKVATRQILEAIQYCHSKSIVHRDLKPENLLYASPAEDAPLKLADFGLAHLLKPKEMMHSACGTPGYVAPEILRGEREGYGRAVDLWSIGVIIYILVCGYPPFADDDNDKLFVMIQNAAFEFHSPYFDEVSGEAKDLICKLLVTEPSHRLTAEQALAHPWLTSVGGRNQNLELAKQQLRKYNARRRFRGAIRVIQLANLMHKQHKDHGTEQDTAFPLHSSDAAAGGGGGGHGV